MKYTTQTLAKVGEKIKETINKVSSAGVALLHPRLICGNSKIGKVWHFSTAAIATCGNCCECCKYCYELKAYLMYPSVLLSRSRNTVLTFEDRERCFAEIDQQIKRKRTTYRFFRWHVGGEIQDMNYLEHMVEIARDNPSWRFYTYTKMYGLVNMYTKRIDGKENMPSNLVIMFSEWEGMPMVNPYNYPTFRVIMADGSNKPLQSDEWLCPGKCKVCIEQKRGCPYGEKVAAHEH